MHMQYDRFVQSCHAEFSHLKGQPTYVGVIVFLNCSCVPSSIQHMSTAHCLA